MNLLGNIFWWIFGGGILGLLWAVSGLICCCTIVLIPFGIQCFKFAGLMLWPFGKDIRYSSKTSSFILNVLWIMFFGWELALISFFMGLFWCISIVGIPFGVQCFKFARLALMPFGAKIV